MRRSRPWLIALLLILAACSLDTGGPEENADASDELPDVIFRKFSHTAMNGARLVFRLEADKAALYNQRKTTELEGVRFVEYDNAGAVAVEGRARRAVFYTETENADLSGDIYGYSAADKVNFRAQELSWNKADRLLQSRGKDIVRIEKEDGSFIEGMYFTVDAGRKSLSYEAAVRGRYIREEDEEKNQ